VTAAARERAREQQVEGEARGETFLGEAQSAAAELDCAARVARGQRVLGLLLQRPHRHDPAAQLRRVAVARVVDVDLAQEGERGLGTLAQVDEPRRREEQLGCLWRHLQLLLGEGVGVGEALQLEERRELQLA